MSQSESHRKLAALLANREKGTAGDWHVPGDLPTFVEDDSHNPRTVCGCSTAGSRGANDALNIAAEHNALPILIRALMVALEAECKWCGNTGEDRLAAAVPTPPCSACAYKREIEKMIEEGL